MWALITIITFVAILIVVLEVLDCPDSAPWPTSTEPWIAFDERPGADHPSFDLVGGAWASPGSIQRVGVKDRSGLVRLIMWGRANPALDRNVDVTEFGPHELAVTWRGSSCDSNATMVVEGRPEALVISVVRGDSAGVCAGIDVVYNSILELETDVQIANVEVALHSGR